MYSYSIATMEDFDTVYEFAKAFYLATPYANTFEFSEARVKEVIRIYLTSPKTEAITVLLSKDGVPVGMIAGVAGKSLFTEGVYTVEQMWWVDPAHRGTRFALGLLKAYEDWAKVIGAEYCVVASIKDVTNLDKLYTKFGYVNSEQSFMKRINN